MEAVSTPFTTVTSSSPRNCSKKRISICILFSPANQAPLRDRPYGASPEDRFTMVSAAVTDTPGLEATDLEIQAGGTNFTLDTLRTLKSKMPDANFSVIIGADQLAKLPRWRHASRISQRNGVPCTRQTRAPTIDSSRTTRSSFSFFRHPRI